MTDPKLRTSETLRALARRLEDLANRLEATEAEGERREVAGDLSGALGACRVALDEASALLPGPPEGTVDILVVDDDPVSRDLMTSFLERYGDVTAAAGGAEALTAVTRAIRSGRHFRLIFLDIMMPEMDGHEVLKRIRGLEEVYTAGSRALIVMTTALGDRATVMRARQAGSEGYFVKPVDLQKLDGWLEGKGFQAVR